MSATRGGTSREWLVIALLTVVGAILRFWAFGRLGLSHFDEGIYAFAGSWALAKNGLLDLDPGIIAYAPPGFPILVGLAYLVFGVNDHAGIAVSVAAGIATIPCAGWFGRRTFGTGAGAAAAAFAALSLAHVAFSRKALTDAPFLLSWFVALGLGARFLERPVLARAVPLGLAVGVAQNLKYNGWLTGAIVAAAALAGVLVNREDRCSRALLRTFGWGLVAALIAALVYLPWYRFVEAHGGYSSLLRHHSGYMDPSGWFGRWRTQLGEAYALSGPGGGAALTALTGWLACALSIGTRSWFPAGPARLSRVLTASAAMVLVLQFCTLGGYFPWWLGLGWTPWLLAAGAPAKRLLGAWWTVMTVLTPLYHPYARLWLPLHGLGWILLGGLIHLLAPTQEMADGGRVVPEGARAVATPRGVFLAVALACGLCAWADVAWTRPIALPWSRVLEPPEPSLRSFARNTVPRTIPGQGTKVCLYATRPLAFYLALLGSYTIELEPASNHLLPGGGTPNSWAVVERGMLMPGGFHDTTEYPWQLVTRKYHSSSIFMLDPVTLLDSQPDAAFSAQPHDAGILHIWSPLAPDLPSGANAGAPPESPDHEP